MTVPSEVNRSGPYTGNGVTTAFDYGFRIVDEDHIQVVLAEGGVETILTIDTDYIVSDVGEASGGQVALVTAPTASQTITLLRNVPFTQETDLENQGPYFAETIERSFDLAAMRDQQLSERLDRAVTVPPSSSAGALEALIADILRLADSADNIDAVADNAANINTVAEADADIDTVVSNISDIQNAPENAALAEAWAEGHEPGGVGTKSAKEWAEAAAASALGLAPFSFDGDGVTVEFTLPATATNVNYVRLAIDGVAQAPGEAYTVSDTTLTFTEAPENGMVIFGFIIAATEISIGVPTAGSVGASALDPTEVAAIRDALSVYSESEADILLDAKEGVSSVGNNANGYYVRFDNGVQICRHRLSGSIAIATAAGNVFRSAHSTWTYPAEFLAGNEPVVTASMFSNSTSGDADTWAGNVYSASVTAAQVNMFSAATKTAATRTIMLTAIGRWK